MKKTLTPQSNRNPLDDLFAQAIALQNGGRPADAERIYRHILSVNPRHADTLHMLGLMAIGLNRFDIAEEFVRKAIAEKNDFAGFHNSLGRILAAQDKLKEAEDSYKRALALKPDDATALFRLAKLFQDQGLHSKALDYYQLLKAIRPDAYSCANIALTYQNMGQAEKAIDYYNQALALMPGYFEFLNNLGMIYDSLEQYENAIIHYQQALAGNPNDIKTLSNLSGTYKNLGKLDEAIEGYRRALDMHPGDALIYSNLLLTMVYASSVTPEQLAAAAREFGTRIADPLLRNRTFFHEKNPTRKLRIGYVSPDFRTHSISYFFEPLLALHDRNFFEIYLYSNTQNEDAVTENLKNKTDHWRNIRLLNDDAAADLIEADKIDILIDLAGHTAGNRLLVFARKPAPVQVTWLGYPATTGLKAIDYRLTDIHSEPPGMTENLNTEKLYRLPEIFCCYQPHENSPDAIDHPPFEDNGYITFGCFNNFAKVTDDVLAAWAKIMDKVPDSKLLLEIAGIDGEKFQAETEERFKRIGLPLNRIIFERRKPENQFVLYNRIDIALDPFPCNGGTTSMDTLWMGIPFITLAGKHFVSRMGVTILKNVGLPELITNTMDEYIECSANLANDKARLKTMRQNLRAKVQNSPVMNQRSFVQNIENAYKEMWKEFCLTST